MCLVKQHSVALHGRNIGYKVIRQVNGKYLPCQMYSPELILNQWITDDNEYVISALDGTKYRTGFHFFTRRVDAEKYALPGDYIATVEFDQQYITAKGSQTVYRPSADRRICDAPTIVCRRVRVTEISEPVT